MGKALTLLALAALLTGCETIERAWPAQQGERDILARGWARPDGQSMQEVYCYGTLADADCYRTPQDGQGFRLIGGFHPPPQ